jgi:hypothetical protein
LGSLALSGVDVVEGLSATVELGASVTRMAVGFEVEAVASRFSVDWAAELEIEEAALAVVEDVEEASDVADATDASTLEVSFKVGNTCIAIATRL